MVNIIDSAFVEILPDVSRFADQLQNDLDQAFEQVQQQADQSLQTVEESFSESADTIGESLDSIDPDFDGVTSQAEAAADEVSDTLDSIDPSFEGIVEGATSAADESASAFDGAGDQISSEFDSASEGAEDALSSIGGAAQSAADEAASSFDGVGDEIGDEFDTASGGVDALRGSFAALAAAIGGAAAIRAATLAAEELNSQLIILESQFDETGTLAGFTRDQLQDLAQESSIRLGVDTSDLIRAQQSVALFTDLTGSEFERTIALSADLAAFMGREVPDAARLLARGLDDPQRGLQLLERQVGSFDEGMVQAVEEMLRFGDTAGAQTLILDEIESRFGGVAEASADTTARLAEAGSELSRTFGQGIIGPLDENVDELLSLVSSLIPVAENLGIAFGTSIDVIAAASPAIEGIADIVGSIPGDFVAAAASAVALNRGLNLIRRNPVGATITGLALAFGAISNDGENAAAAIADVDLSLDRLARGEIDQEAQALVDTFTDLTDISVDLGDRLGAIDALSPQNFDIFRAFNTGAVEAREFDEALEQAVESASGFDQQLANMAQGGSADQVSEILRQIQEQSGLTSAEFQELAEQILPQTTTRLTQVSEAAEDTAIATTAVGEAIATVEADNTAGALGNLVVALRDSEVAADDATAAEQALGIASEDLLAVTPQVADAFELLSQQVTTSMPSVSSAVENAFAAADEAQRDFTFQDFVDELEATLQEAQDFNTNVAALIEGGFTDIAALAVERGPAFAQAAADALSDPQILRDAQGLMDDIALEVDTGLNNAGVIAFQGADEAGGRILDGLESGSAGSASVGRTAVQGVVDGIGQRENRLDNRARGAMSSAISSARDRARDADEVGGSFASGIISGIREGIQGVAQAAADSANAAVSSARFALRALSPSRRTAEEIGLPFTQGIAVGMTDGQPEVDRAFNDIIDGLTMQTRTVQPVRLGDVSDEEWQNLLDRGWRGDPTDRMEALFPPGFDASDIGTPIGPQIDTSDERRIVIELRSDGSAMGDLLLEQLREAIRVQGGDVQEVIGSGTTGASQ